MQILEEMGWYPGITGLFVGALHTVQVHKAPLMKKMSKVRGSAGTDTSRDYEYTNWNDVRNFAEEFLEVLP